MTNLRDNSQLPLFFYSALTWHPLYERWKPIQGFEGYYEISNYGRVKSVSRMAGLKPIKCIILKAGARQAGSYLFCKLYKKQVPTPVTIHRLVAIHFIPNPENKPEVNHKDGVKGNPHYLNLEWSTHAENIQHSFDVLKRKPTKNYGYYGSNKKPVAEVSKSGEIIKIYDCIVYAGKETKINPRAIGRVCRGERTHTKRRHFIYYAPDEGNKPQITLF